MTLPEAREAHTPTLLPPENGAGSVHGHAPQPRLATTRRWWCDVPRWLAAADCLAAAPRCASYRFGDVILDVDSHYRPLLEDLDSAYGDCAVPENTVDDCTHVRCSARLVDDQALVVLRFAASGLPHLMDIALRLIRPRAELQHFSVRPLGLAGWRLLGNDGDAEAPLLAADTHRAVLDVRLGPDEFLLNYVVGVAQLAQPSVIFLHAGGVSIDGRGTLLLGRSGQGKSTTTVALASRGHVLLGDETVGMRAASGELLPFRRTLRLRPGPRPQVVTARLGAVPHEMRLDAYGTPCDWVQSSRLFPGDPPPRTTPLSGVFFLRDFRDHAAVESFVPSLAHLEELRALTMSLSTIVSWPLAPAHRLMRFLRVIDVFAKSSCYFLDLGTPDETAALIERTVREQCY